MAEILNGIVEKHNIFIGDRYEYESWTSSETKEYPEIPCTCRSYSSLELLPCEETNEEECRLVKLNNTLKHLLDIIDDPVKSEDVACVCCMLFHFLKYNGKDGYYVKFLPMIGEVLEFVTMRAKHVDEYLDYLCELLKLCSKPPLLMRSSEILNAIPNLKRHFSLLGYLMIIAPTKCCFLLVKCAIEQLLCDNDDEKGRRKWRRDAVRPEVRREAVEGSRLPVTLAEIAECASIEVYPAILEMTLAVACASRCCCYRILATGIENTLLLRMHPEYNECNCKHSPITDDTDLQLDREDYQKTLECSTKILWQLVTSTIFVNELPEWLQCLAPPTKAAMWSLRGAFRREVLLARGSARSRRLRNTLANLILAHLIADMCESRTTWELVESGIAEDVATLVVATEWDVRNSWAETAYLGCDVDKSGLAFKRTLLLIVALLVDVQPKAVPVLQDRQIIFGILQLMNANFEATRTPWNTEQLCHLFKYASNALTYLAPKIPEEFIIVNGSQRLLTMLEELKKVSSDDAHVACLIETICSLSAAKCDAILNDFRKNDIVPTLLELITIILNFEALSLIHQKIISFLLITIENILENHTGILECHCGIVTIAKNLLQRCLNQKPEDSALEQSFLIAIASYIWKCLVDFPSTLRNFLEASGVYLLLDLLERVNLAVQNFYLGLLADICKNTCCIRYMFSWRCADKKTGVMSLFANIWREEEQIFGVERTQEGCIDNMNTPLKSDDKWLYLYFTKSVRNSTNIITAAMGQVRPKIHYVIKLLQCEINKCQEGYYKKLCDELPVEDQITLETIESYDELNEAEATLAMSELLDQVKVGPLSKSRSPLLDYRAKLQGGVAEQVRKRQVELLERFRTLEIKELRNEYRRIHNARLSPAFDALEELALVGRTSARGCLLAAKAEQLEKLEAELRELPDSGDGPFYRTFNVDSNVTTVFNQQLKIQCIPKRCMNDLTKDVSMIFDTPPAISSDTSSCSGTSGELDSLFLRKPAQCNIHRTPSIATIFSFQVM